MRWTRGCQTSLFGAHSGKGTLQVLSETGLLGLSFRLARDTITIRGTTQLSVE
jgi:hypothetical protein